MYILQLSRTLGGTTYGLFTRNYLNVYSSWAFSDEHGDLVFACFEDYDFVVE